MHILEYLLSSYLNEKIGPIPLSEALERLTEMQGKSCRIYYLKLCETFFNKIFFELSTGLRIENQLKRKKAQSVNTCNNREPLKMVTF